MGLAKLPAFASIKRRQRIGPADRPFAPRGKFE